MALVPSSSVYSGGVLKPLPVCRSARWSITRRYAPGPACAAAFGPPYCRTLLPYAPVDQVYDVRHDGVPRVLRRLAHHAEVKVH